MDRSNEMLHACENISRELDIPYFSVVNNIYEPYKDNNMNEYNRDFVQELYVQGIFNLEYRKAFKSLLEVDNRIGEWIIPVFAESYIDYLKENEGITNFDSSKESCDAIYYTSYKHIDNEPRFYTKVYNLGGNNSHSRFYLISEHDRMSGPKVYYGHKVNLWLSKDDKGREYFALLDNWITREGTLKEINTELANDYIESFFVNKTIPQTKFNLGEEFFISQLIKDFKGIINDDNFELDELNIDSLLETVKKECSNR